jgi:hypothetical protein
MGREACWDGWMGPTDAVDGRPGGAGLGFGGRAGRARARGLNVELGACWTAKRAGGAWQESSSNSRLAGGWTTTGRKRACVRSPAAASCLVGRRSWRAEKKRDLMKETGRPAGPALSPSLLDMDHPPMPSHVIRTAERPRCADVKSRSDPVDRGRQQKGRVCPPLRAPVITFWIDCADRVRAKPRGVPSLQRGRSRHEQPPRRRPGRLAGRGTPPDATTDRPATRRRRLALRGRRASGRRAAACSLRYRRLLAGLANTRAKAGKEARAERRLLPSRPVSEAGYRDPRAARARTRHALFFVIDAPKVLFARSRVRRRSLSGVRSFVAPAVFPTADGRRPRARSFGSSWIQSRCRTVRTGGG